MGRNDPPFLYDPPSQHEYPSSSMGNFNPRAVTQHTWAPRPPRPKPNGPLVNFNRHPDSYAVIPTGRSNVNTMSPRTKSRVKYARWIQLGLRVLTLIGALGMLFCVICIRHTSTAIAWMIRIPPSVSIAHTLYAIYHLSRTPSVRPPRSSASYFLFASVLDAGLIPLYVLTAIMAKVEHMDGVYEWETLFETAVAEDKIFYATFLGCSIVGGLHLAALVLDLYLAVTFRRIAKLPPDMNPLEDNLTSRPHKHSKSEIAEKHLSGSTIVSSDADRDSLAQESFPTRSVPFMHTRTNSNSQAPEEQHSLYSAAQSHRYSRSDLPSQLLRQQEQTNQPKPAIARAPARRAPSRPQSVVIDAPSEPEQEQGQNDSAGIHARDPSGVSSLTMDNWFVYGSEPPSPVHSRPGSPAFQTNNLGPYDRPDLGNTGTVKRSQGAYSPLSFYNDDENLFGKTHTENLYNDEIDLGEDNKIGLEGRNGGDTRILFNPLEMNPPTPQPPGPETTDPPKSQASIRREALADLPNPSSGSSRSTPVKSPNAGKLGSYGGLGQSTPLVQENADDNDADDFHKTTPSKSGKKRWRRKSGRVTLYDSLKTGEEDDLEEDEKPHTPGDTDRKGRVVSNSGIDLGNGLGAGYSSYIAGLGVGRRRDVSGKVAEEGRGGGVGNNGSDTGMDAATTRKLSKSREIKAAGWARWKGM